MLHNQFATAPAVAAIALLAATSMAADVEQIWVDRIDGPGHLSDYGESVAISPLDGAIYVTGFIFEQVPGLQGGTLYSPRFLTTRYDEAGEQVWQRTCAGTFASGASAARHVEVDFAGNVIVSGSTNQGHDWATIKYDADGNELWTHVYEGSSSYLIAPDDMALDSTGNVYLVGFQGGAIDFGTVLKLNGDGSVVWERTYTGPTSTGAGFQAVAVDAEGNVYAGGYAIVPNRAGEFAIVKYDVNGTLQWLYTDGAFGAVTYDSVRDLAVDLSGNVVGAGYFGSNSAAGTDAVTVKLDANGNELWQRISDAGEDDSLTAVAVDNANAVIVAGWSENGPSDGDALTLKYDLDGNFAWEQRVSGDETHDDYASSLALDDEGNVYVCGEYDPIGGTRFFAVRYRTADGLQEWFADYAGPMGGGSRASDIAVGANSVCVTGDSPAPATEFDMTTIRYEQTIKTAQPGDATGDGLVDALDMLVLLGEWGKCPACPSDFNGDAVVDALDFLALLANWS